MKIIRILCVGLLAQAIVAPAQVPSLLNYQGYLQDASGNPATGSVNIAISLYTNASGSSAVYSENIGSVALDKGIYSFNWGLAGTATVSAVEQIAMADGVQTVFNYTVQHFPVINPSVTIYDGTYSWNDVSGSSNPSRYLGTVSSYPLGSVSAVYLSVIPPSGTQIMVRYSYHEVGVSNVLQAGNALWLEMTIEGSALSPRQRLLAVPYASTSQWANEALKAQRTDESSFAASTTNLMAMILQLQNQLSELNALNNITNSIDENFITTYLGTQGGKPAYVDILKTQCTHSLPIKAYVANLVTTNSDGVGQVGPGRWGTMVLSTYTSLYAHVTNATFYAVGWSLYPNTQTAGARFYYSDGTMSNQLDTGKIPTSGKNISLTNPSPQKLVSSV